MAYTKNPLGLVGYPLLVFFIMKDYGKNNMSHIERLTELDKWYSHLRARLPELYAKKADEYALELDPKLKDVDGELQAAWQKYNPLFEGLQACSEDEKIFNRICSGVYQRLDEITAISRLVEGVSSEEFEVG